jgi:hypothetical protein
MDKMVKEIVENFAPKNITILEKIKEEGFKKYEKEFLEIVNNFVKSI